ncbi:MAG: MCP four helix bundle domain-containing protein [Burkholderiales bacterium]|nr:MCP four helix bundle domain-containing protein [Burkholderiales bacterium]
MSLFQRLTLSRRLVLAFGLAIVLSALLGAVGFLQLREVNGAATELQTQWMPSVRGALEWRSDLQAIRLATLQHAMAPSEREKRRHAQVVTAAIELYKQHGLAVEATLRSDEQRKLLQEIRGTSEALLDITRKVLEVSSQEGTEAALAMQNAEARPRAQQIEGRMDRLVALAVAGGNQAGAASQRTYDIGRAVLAGGVLLSVLLGVGLATAVTRSVQRQLGGDPAFVAQVVERVAAGDLTITIPVHPKDQGSLLASMRRMVGNLSGIVSGVRSGAESITTASREVASGNLDLSTRTETQAASVQQTASTLHELAGTVGQTAEASRRATELAAGAAQVAEQGGAVVGEVVAQMQEITAASRRIGEIIGVIDGIAFQTNILALNAAVEAARAGEQGRGFAVVAAEVRSLAQRSAGAAKEIKTLIRNSEERVEAGAARANDAGRIMQDVVSSVHEVSGTIRAIAEATVEQSAGIEQVNQSVAQMDSATQHNAALVEQSSAAAESLKEQAEALTRAVSAFHVS